MSAKIAIIATLMLVGMKPNMASAEVDDKAIISMCNDKWSDNFEMVAYCRKQQRAAGKAWASILDAAKPKSPTEAIIQSCVAKWSSNYEMLVYCHDQQQEALQALAIIPDDVPSDIFGIISSKCESKWGDNFEMVKYCQDQQIEAWRSLK